MAMQLEQKLQEQVTIWLNSLLLPNGNRIRWSASAGGMRVNMRTAIKMKRAGYKKGHPDINIYEAFGGWHGMMIETKCGAYPGPEQKEWRDALLERGYYAVIVPGRFDFWEARKWIQDQVERYIRGEIKRPSKEWTCPHCFLDIALRNPSGYCDHLHYPESCKACQELRRR